MDDYVSLVRQVVGQHAAAIETDLRAAISELERTRKSAADAESRVLSLQTLLHFGSTDAPPTDDDSRLTLHEAMAEVLRSAPEQMMRARDLAAEIHRRHLYVMRDGRPVEPQQIHARVGHYGDLFEKVGTFIRLRG